MENKSGDEPRPWREKDQWILDKFVPERSLSKSSFTARYDSKYTPQSMCLAVLHTVFANVIFSLLFA